MTAPEVNNVVEEQPQVTTQDNTIATETPSGMSEVQQMNWKKFREDREAERKAREEADRRAAEKSAEAEALKAAMEALLNKNQPRQQEIHDDYQDESDDQKIEKQVNKILADREKLYEQQRAQREAQEMPQRLSQTYTDFEKICTTENLDYLEYHYPEVAAAFKHAPDSFDKWSNIYKAVKRFVPNTSQKEQRKAESNFNKPQAMAVAGSTQTSDEAPRMLDEKRRADNWARMQRVMKGAK